MLPRKIKYSLSEDTPIVEIKRLIEKSQNLAKENMKFIIVQENQVKEFCEDNRTVNSLVEEEGQCFIYEIDDAYIDK